MDTSAVESFIGLFEARRLPREHWTHQAQNPQLPFDQSLRALLDSPIAGRVWPFSYYSRERLLSVAARRGWLPPDLKDTIP